jgi:hypothetical protein
VQTKKSASGSIQKIEGKLIMNVSPEIGRQLGEGIQAGLAQAVTESASHANVVAHWYKPILAHPFLASFLVMLSLMMVGHLFVVYLCRRSGIPASVPLTTLWGSFGVSLAVGSLAYFPPLSVGLLTSAFAYFVYWQFVMRRRNQIADQ